MISNVHALDVKLFVSGLFIKCMGNTSLHTLIQIPSHLIGCDFLYCIETRKFVQIN